MRIFKRSTAWALMLCLIMSLALTVVPAAAEDNIEIVDPYVYYWQPAAEMVPDYYARYARPYMLYSGHNVHHKGMDEGGIFQVRFFNVVNTDALIEDEAEAPSGGYATTGTFCADAETYIVAGTAYRRMNLEDGYFNSDSTTLAGTVDARKIRAVLRNSITNLDDLPAFEQKVNAYLTATYGDEAVLVSSLSGSQLLSATQASVWHYANGFDFSDPYPYQSSDDFANWSELTIDSTTVQISYPDYPSSFMDIANDTTATNISGVYQYLLSLPGESPREIMITDESISLADAVISGDQGTITLLVDVNGTINADDALNLTVKCGDQTKSFSLGSVNTLDAVNGLYPITLTGVSAEDCEAVELVISGTQAVDDVCYFEAKPTEETDGRKTSQNLTGFGHDTAPVYSEASMNVLAQSSLLEITKVDAQSGNPLSGVAFDLYRKTEGGDLRIGSYVTDSSGKISVHVTDTEEFYFVETGALEGYQAVTGQIAAGEVPNSWNAGSLEVSKKLINETPAQVGETFNFKLTLDLSTAPVMGNEISWMTEKHLMDQLECSKELSWTVSGSQELTAIFTLDADEKVTVSSIPLGTTYTLEEVMTEEDRQWFHVTTQVDGEAAQKSNIASGSIASENAILFTNSVATSEVQYGQLAVSKKLVNTTPALVGETFNFEITLDFSTADVYADAAPWINDEYLLEQVSCTEDLDWTKKDSKYTATFTVDAEETVTMDGLAFGTTYTLEEVMTEEDRQWFTVTSKVCNDPIKTSPVAQGNIAAVNAVLFTNSVVTDDVKLGELDISKKLVNTTPAQVGETFNFKITLDFSTADIYTKNIPWMNDDYLMDFVTSTENLSWTMEDGKYTADFTVDADETVTFYGIAQGTTYTVQEVLTEEDRQWFESNAQIGDEDVKGSVAQSTVAEKNAVAFTNSVVTGPVLVTGSVEVSKKLINTTPAQVGETFNFQITLDLSTADVYTDAAPWMNDEYLMSFVSGSQELTWTEEEGKYTAAFTVNADETFSINGIAQGATYTLQEVLTDEDREWFITTCQIGDEEAQASDTVTSTVAEKNAVTFTNSVVTGIALSTGRIGVGKDLTNAPSALTNQRYSFRITLDLSDADIYQDPAPWMYDDILLSRIVSNQELTWTKSGDKLYTATFTLQAGETINLDGVALGTGFIIEEVLAPAERQNYRVTTSVSTNGGAAVQNESTSVNGNVSDATDVVFVNKYVAPIPVTDDLSLTAPLVLCLLALMMTAVLILILNKPI